MKNTNKVTLLIVIVCLLGGLALTIYTSVIGCNGCGGCEYVAFEEVARVNSIEYEEDSIVDVDFITENGDKIYFYGFYKFNFEFELDEFEDESNQFLISGERITRGTCVPNYFNKVEMIKLNNKRTTNRNNLLP